MFESPNLIVYTTEDTVRNFLLQVFESPSLIVYTTAPWRIENEKEVFESPNLIVYTTDKTLYLDHSKGVCTV